MAQKGIYPWIKSIVVIMAMSVLAACSSSVSGVNEPERGRLVKDQNISTTQCPDKSGLNAILSSSVVNVWILADPVLSALPGKITALKKYSQYTAKQVVYTSVDNQGKQLHLSGLLIVPQSSDGSIQKLPILSIQHPTQLETSSAPSENLSSMPVELAAVMACAGYAVLMPDYEGFGVSNTMHPYVVAKPLVNSVVDLIRAVRDYQTQAFTWNQKLYLMGFSEGGFVTMATAREIQENLSSEFTVTAAAPLEGPYDLSGTMLKEMLTTTPVIAPFFLPYAILGYYHAYSDPLFFQDNSMITPYNTTLPPMFDGTHGMLDVNKQMPSVPSKILTQAFIAQMSAVGQVTNYLKMNNSYPWVPRMPLMMFHHTDDTIVPYGNAQTAIGYFNTAGSQTAQLTTLKFTSPYPVHIFGFAPIMMEGFLWLNGQ